MARTKTRTQKAAPTPLARVEAIRKLALERVNDAREAAIEQAAHVRSRAVDAVSRLEKVFEQRVARAMARLGVPSARDVRALARRVAELQASVETLQRKRARA
jgi:poly(hydroxyalkanoate) granule-associated protein